MGIGLETLFHLVYEFFHWAISWVFPQMVHVRSDQRGVLVNGRKSRVVPPGHVWFWRNWSTLFVETIARRAPEMGDQPLTTQDDSTVRVGGVLVYTIEDVQKWILENEDPEHGLLVEASRVIRDYVVEHSFEEVQGLAARDEDDDEDDELTAEARLQLEGAFGVRVHRLGLTAFAEARVMDLNHCGSAINVEMIGK